MGGVVKMEKRGTYDAIPSFVVPAVFDHQIGPLAVVVQPSLPVRLAWRHHGDAIDRPVFPHGVEDLLLRRGAQGFGVRAGNGLDGTVLILLVPGQGGGVEGSSVVVTSTYDVELVDAVGADVLLLAEMRRAMGEFLVPRDHLQGTVAAVALVAGGE